MDLAYSVVRLKIKCGLRYSEEPVPPARLAYYALALNAICRDPREYYGHNLVGKSTVNITCGLV